MVYIGSYANYGSGKPSQKFLPPLFAFWGALLWLGTMTNRSVVTVAHNGLKSKQARKNSELVFGWNHELRMTPKVINFNQKDYAKVPKDFCNVSFGYVLKYC